METVKTFLDSFKELIWDIIGYFLPGFFLILILSVSIQSEFYFISTLSDSEDIKRLILFITSYVLGFVIYGLGFLKEQILGKYSYKVKIENSIKSRNDFSDVHDIVAQKIESETGKQHPKPYGVRELRNIVMQKDDEQKIYTFTFRSDLAANVGNTLLVIGMFGLFFSLIKCFSDFQIGSDGIFKIGVEYTLLYIVMVLAYFLLRYTRNRFYDIAMRLPFSIFLSQKFK